MKNKLYPSLVIVTSLLMGCNSSKDDIYLSCNGFSETINVYGNNIEQKRESLVIPVQIRRLDGLLEGLLNPPVYQIQIGYTVFENSHLFVDKTQYVGTHKRLTDSNGNQTESRFNINRNTNHFIYYDFSFSPKTKELDKTQKTIDFEGKCERVKERI